MENLTPPAIVDNEERLNTPIKSPTHFKDGLVRVVLPIAGQGDPSIPFGLQPMPVLHLPLLIKRFHAGTAPNLNLLHIGQVFVGAERKPIPILNALFG